jgi:Cu-Zn family superoxide dismutase
LYRTDPEHTAQGAGFADEEEEIDMKRGTTIFCGLLVAIMIGAAWADQIVIDMHDVNAKGVGKKIGTLTASETPYGTLFSPALTGLTPGLHGFHLHAVGQCGAMEKDGRMVPGLAAGGHFDPGHTGSHKGPYADGHLGDLPALYADQSGRVDHPVLAPRVRLKDLKGHSLVIHAGGDNYSDTPEPLGGGGARIACGVIPE